MKRRIGTLYGKPVVEGSANMVNKNEVYIKNKQDNTLELCKRKEDNKLVNIAGGNSDGYEYWKMPHDYFDSFGSTVMVLLMMLSRIGAVEAFRVGNRALQLIEDNPSASSVTLYAISQDTLNSFLELVGSQEDRTMMFSVRTSPYIHTTTDRSTITQRLISGGGLINILQEDWGDDAQEIIDIVNLSCRKISREEFYSGIELMENFGLGK